MRIVLQNQIIKYFKSATSFIDVEYTYNCFANAWKAHNLLKIVRKISVKIIHNNIPNLKYSLFSVCNGTISCLLLHNWCGINNTINTYSMIMTTGHPCPYYVILSCRWALTVLCWFHNLRNQGQKWIALEVCMHTIAMLWPQMIIFCMIWLNLNK